MSEKVQICCCCGYINGDCPDLLYHEDEGKYLCPNCHSTFSNNKIANILELYQMNKNKIKTIVQELGNTVRNITNELKDVDFTQVKSADDDEEKGWI